MRHSPAKPEASQIHYTFDFEFKLGLYVQKPFPGESACQRTPHSIACMHGPCVRSWVIEHLAMEKEVFLSQSDEKSSPQAHPTEATEPTAVVKM